MAVREDLSGTKLGNYRLERVIGAGRMGVVYLARDEALLRPTAVKLLSWEFAPQEGYNPEAWFLAEARNVARINHPSVIQIYSVARHGNHCYIAMEYVDGLSAHALIDKSGPLPLEKATSILHQVASALQAAHESNVIHRDIKPENLLIRSDGAAKLGDFGMALHTSGAAQADTTRAGTPYYTAPEIWNGAAASPLTDIYALGATFFYLLTGHPPVQAKDLNALINAHVQGNVEDIRNVIPGIPERCRELIRKCMARRPQERYQSAQALAWEAKGILKELRRGWPAPIGEKPSHPEILRPVARQSDPALPAWAEFFGFRVLPFGPTNPAQAPAIGEPFSTAKAELSKCLKANDSNSVLFLGPNGSGRSTSVRRLIARLTGLGPVVFVSQQSNMGLIQQAARAFGATGEVANVPEKNIEALLNQLDTRLEQDAKRALIVIDDVVPTANCARELSILVNAAEATRFFNILCIGAPELEVLLRKQGVFSSNTQTRIVTMPPMTGTQTHNYLNQWIKASQGPGAQPVIITPDAAFLACYQSGGVASRVNRIARGMLYLAWTEKSRVLNSWHARAASDFLVPEGESSATVPVRPKAWPPANMVEMLNKLRRENGMPPRSDDASVDSERMRKVDS